MGQKELSYLPRTLIRSLTSFLAIFAQYQRLREGPLPSGSSQFHGGGEICSPKNGEWKQSKVQGRSQGPVVRVEKVRREGFREQGDPKALSLIYLKLQYDGPEPGVILLCEDSGLSAVLEVFQPLSL